MNKVTAIVMRLIAKWSEKKRPVLYGKINRSIGCRVRNKEKVWGTKIGWTGQGVSKRRINWQIGIVMISHSLLVS